MKVKWFCLSRNVDYKVTNLKENGLPEMPEDFEIGAVPNVGHRICWDDSQGQPLIAEILYVTWLFGDSVTVSFDLSYISRRLSGSID